MSAPLFVYLLSKPHAEPQRAGVKAIFWVLLLALGLAGCTSNSNAKAQAREAFVAGQQQALARMLQARAPNVTVLGPVHNPVMPWTEDLTLAKAIVAAGYYGRTDPKGIVIHRNGQEMPVDPKQLLSGEDVPLQAGDVVEVRP